MAPIAFSFAVPFRYLFFYFRGITRASSAVGKFLFARVMGLSPPEMRPELSEPQLARCRLLICIVAGSSGCVSRDATCLHVVCASLHRLMHTLRPTETC
jgi:hypothetical protein